MQRRLRLQLPHPQITLRPFRKLPPEHQTERRNQYPQPQRVQTLPDARPLRLFLRVPVLHDLVEEFGIVRNHAVDVLADGPLHEVGLVDGPEEQGAGVLLDVADEARAEGIHEGALQHVERHPGDLEELARVAGGEADVGDGEAREGGAAEREVFGGPDAEDDAGRPGAGGGGRGGGDGGGDEGHDFFGRVVEFDVEEEPDVVEGGVGKVGEEVGEAGHRGGGFFDGAEGGDV